MTSIDLYTAGPQFENADLKKTRRPFLKLKILERALIRLRNDYFRDYKGAKRVVGAWEAILFLATGNKTTPDLL